MRNSMYVALFMCCFATYAHALDSRYRHVSAETTIGELVEHPAFASFGEHLLTRESDLSRQELPLRNVATLLPYHTAVDVPTVIASINHMIDEVSLGKTIFYSFYSEQEQQADRGKTTTGLFFFRGNPGAPFSVICPGGGFSYVGSFHEGFPYAMELSKRGYNAFVLRYRVGGGGTPAVADLAAALAFIFANADALDVGAADYSLWGSSAGARMAAYIGSYGTQGFTGVALPKPGAVVMAYTGYTDFSPDDPPTYVIVGDRDGIAPASVMENRVRKMQAAGVTTSISIIPNTAHGFGLGVGTAAHGWIHDAIAFWEGPD